MSLTYAGAAFEVLGRLGKAMHYETISSTALRLGLLETASKHPHITFSTTLSRVASENHSSPFRKAKPGVYELQRRFRIQDIGATPDCAQKLDRIREAAANDEPDILIFKKGLFLLRNAIELVEDRWIVFLGLSNRPFQLRPAGLHAEDYVFTSRPVALQLDLVRAAAGLRSKLDAREILQVFVVALALLEAAIEEADEGEILLTGDRGARTLQLFSVGT